eukprot:1181948-Prorocentrum_minimum.AAC.3
MASHRCGRRRWRPSHAGSSRKHSTGSRSSPWTSPTKGCCINSKVYNTVYNMVYNTKESRAGQCCGFGTWHRRASAVFLAAAAAVFHFLRYLTCPLMWPYCLLSQSAALVRSNWRLITHKYGCTPYACTTSATTSKSLRNP